MWGPEVSEQLQILKVNKSITDTSVHNLSKLIDKNRKPLMLQPPMVQAKLAINQPGDEYEQEADRVAEQVMRMPDPIPQRKCDECDEDEKKVIQAKESPGQAQVTQDHDVPAIIHEALRSPSQQLDEKTRAFMEPRFGFDFSRVRVHNGATAEKSARKVNGNAYTVGHNVVFGASHFAPGTDEGRWLIAHELTHVIQQTTEPVRIVRPVIQRFSSQEHVHIGSNVLPGREVQILNYGKVSYGEMIALGDYFYSLQEMQDLAKMGSFGQKQIDYARWKVNQSLTKPEVDSTVEKAVEERYKGLVAVNETHFSTGSTPGLSNREQYIGEHTTAIIDAYHEGLMPTAIGRGFEAQEAFANHFLTDAFSAGHIRTPRGQIQTHWNGLYPNFSNNLIQTISCYMASYINDRDYPGYVIDLDLLAYLIAPVIQQRGGKALSLFSIGDLISKLMHDADDACLDVVSSRGPRMGGTPSPYRWKAVGDEFLYTENTNKAAMETQQIVEEAVRLSFQEVQQAYSAGASKNSAAFAKLINPSNFRALALIPTEDIASITNPAYNWLVSSISALPVNLRNLLVAAFAPGTEIRRHIDSMPVPEEYYSLHTGLAWNCFKGLLLEKPFNMIERICNGYTCPPGKYNPCPDKDKIRKIERPA